MPLKGQSLVICDAVHKDQTTGKFTLLGTFSALFAPGFPCRHPQIAVYAAVNECRQPTPVRLRLVRINPDDGSDEQVFAIDGEVNASDPLETIEIGLAGKNVVFPAAGEYRLQLESDGDILLSRRLIVKGRHHANKGTSS